MTLISCDCRVVLINIKGGMTSRSAAVVAAAERISSYVPSGSGIAFTGGDVATLFALTKENMEAIYNACEWKWDDSVKLKELSHSKNRFLQSVDLGGSVTGFVCFRFLVDDKRPVLYVYELQVRAAHAGKGIGKSLMAELERLCMQQAPGIQAILLTCFKHNEAAILFYKKLGFKPDKTSPDNRSYVILSKPVNAFR